MRDPSPADADPDGDAPLLEPGPFAVLLGFLLAFGAYQAAVLPTNIDVAWYLHAGGRLLDGGRLYADVVDVNPPLVLWLGAAVVGLARAAHVPPTAAMTACVLALAGGSLAMCARLLAEPVPRALREGLLLGMAALSVQVGGMFGQREHVMLLAVLPYACAVARLAGGGEVAPGMALATGGLAGLGFALKPYFVPAFLGVELYLAMSLGRRAWARPQAMAAGAVLAAYAGAVALITPEYFALARAARPLYAAYHPYGSHVRSGSWRAAVVALAVAASWSMTRTRTRSRPASRALADVLGVLAVALAIAVYLQGKGWRYHWFPAMGLATLLFATALSASRRAAGSARLATGLAFAAPVACLYVLAPWANRQDPAPAVEAAVRSLARGDSIAALSTYLGAGFPLVNRTGVGWASRHPTLWQVPGFRRGGDPRALPAWDDLPAAERAFLGGVVSDLIAARPALLLVDRRPPTPDLRGFDYLAYLGREPRFAALFAAYAPLPIDGGRYRVYVRRDARAAAPPPQARPQKVRATAATIRPIAASVFQRGTSRNATKA
jgi:hypothetical protein